MKDHTLPRLPLALFRRFCKPSYHKDIEGDLIQHYERNVMSVGKNKAYWLLLSEVIRLFRPGIIKPLRLNFGKNPQAMLRHNILLSFRNFMRYKTSFFINVAGLSTGMACVILIFLWVNDELAMDRFYDKGDRLYQVLENVEQNGGIITRESTSGPMAALLVAEMPEVESAITSSWRWPREKVLTVDDKDIKANALYADEPFFRMFSFTLMKGSPDRVLRDKSSIVLSKKLAVSFFGSPADAMGKAIQLDHDKQFQVTGVMEDISAQSSTTFDFVLNFEVLRDADEWLKSWGSTAPQTHVLLKPGADPEAFNKKVVGVVRARAEGRSDHRTQFLRKVTDAYLYGRYENGKEAGGRIEYVELFSIIAVFILIIACMNFMNLSTARASRRMREVGVKKSLGAMRWSLVSQFLSESTLIAMMSLVAAIVFVIILLPQFNLLTGKHLSLDMSGRVLWFIPLIALVTGIVAGSYPALYLSRFRPAVVLKGKLAGSFGESFARKGLAVFQFATSIVLIVSVVVVQKQIEFVQTKDIGYKKDNVLLFSREGAIHGKEEVFMNELEKIPGVVGVSASSHDMTGHNSGTSGISWPGKDQEDRTEFERFSTTHGMIEMMGIEVIAGRSLSTDSSDENSIIFNEAGIKYMGIEDPIGKQVKLGDDPYTIIGVVKDFNFESMHEPIKPLFMIYKPEWAGAFMVRIEGGRETDVLPAIEKFYASFNPGFPFAYHFLDEDYQTMYQAEQRVSKLSGYFAGLAIVISCLGLFGLAAFTAERRMKEIGIRKVLGSGNGGIVLLLSEEFSKVMLISLVVAIPISWFMTSRWLESFQFRIDLEWWFFALSGLAAIFVAWLAVWFQTVKAARVNPVECLKGE